MYYIFRAKGLKGINNFEMIVKPLTLLLGRSWKRKSLILRSFWLTLRTLNPLYVSLFSTERARDEEDYVKSAERMVETLGPEVISDFPSSLIDKGSLAAKIMVETSTAYSEIVLDPEGIGIRINISDEGLKMFIKTSEENLRSKVGIKAKALEIFDPLLLGYERVLLGRLLKVPELLPRFMMIVNEQRRVIETALRRASKVEDYWLKRLMESLELRSLWEEGVVTDEEENIDLSKTYCPIASVLPIALPLLLPSPKTIVIENPELCLHPERILRLAQLIAAKVKEHNKFLLISTDSDYFLYKINNLALLYLRGNYVSREEESLALDPNIISVYRLKEDGSLNSVQFARGFNEDEFLAPSEEIYLERTQILREIELGPQRFC